MSRDAPSLDDIYGPGAEAADAFAGHLQDLAERFDDLGCGTDAREKVYEAELEKFWQENRLLEGQLVSAGEEIERLRAAHEPAASLTAPMCPECGWVGEFRPSQPPSAWQLIETAPLDGRHVLAVDDGVVNEMRYIEGDGWYLAGNDPTDSWGPGPLQPTHWMPLPSAPETKGDSNAS